MAFSRRIINLRFILGSGDFGQGGNNAVDIEGLRCSVNIERQGVGFAQADVQIWGMSLDLMNKLTVLNKVRFEQQRFNQLIISAGDEDNGVAVCFGGTIREAWADGQQIPDMEFIVSADSAMFALMKPIPPTSYKGSVDAATVISGIAQQMGYSFENSGVSAKLSNPYKAGAPKDQIKSICRDVNCQSDVDESRKVVAIWPQGEARGGKAIRVAADTGLVGYPAFTQSGIRFRTLYNPNLEFGRLIEVESQFTGANGEWQVMKLSHHLEANVPGGAWFTDIECNYLDQKA